MSRRWLCTSLMGGALALAGCPSDPMTGMDMTGGGADMSVTAVKVLKRASRSSTITISDDDTLVAVCNADDRSVSFFTTANNTRLSKVTVGGEPSSVVLHPDGKTAFVSVRADATVVKITGIDTAAPTVSAPTAVGAEPTGLALSPTGAKLFVAEYAESKIGVIDTATMVRTDFVASIRSPRSLLVTNNGDMSDADETVVAPEFFGVPVAGAEGKDNGRTGSVRLFAVNGGAPSGNISFPPLTQAQLGIAGTLANGAAPNQLFAVATAQGRIYIPSVSASPEAAPRFDSNVAPVMYVADLASKSEVRGGNGTTNLASLVNALPTPRFFLAETVDLDFVPSTRIAYAVSRGAEVVQRIDYSGATPALGSTMNKQIDLIGAPGNPNLCQNPNGIAIAATQQRAYVNCWGNQKLSVIDLGAQAVLTTVDSATLATSPVTKGRHFFFTGRGRWSGNGTATTPPTEHGAAWSSCGTCHPDGLSDNMTWIFAAGPRQTTSMDGSFSHSPSAPTQKQRIFNWSAIIDEMHDFEANTRGTSGGMGALTTATGQCTLTNETRQGLSAAPLGTPSSTSLHNTAGNCVTDWNDINEYAKTIRPPRGLRFLDAASVARGATLFGVGATGGGCVNCHGGQGWTVSRRHYDPTLSATVTTVTSTAYTRPAVLMNFNDHVAPTTQIVAQPLASDNFVTVAIPPLQTSCNMRKVGTFGVPGNVAATDALEIRAGTFPNGVSTSNRAQGRGGYNVPSLYGMSLGAPYLHHGQAMTLDELFTDTKWQTHWQAGAANFLAGASAAQDRKDLVNFILSIDGSTTEQAIPANFNAGCAP
jgi:DNA-binding beta-propeller fold protein YncE